jgi:hypothetical protein
MPHFDDVTQRAAIEAVRQQFEKAAEVAGIEFFGRRELPEQGAETIAEFHNAGIQEPFDRVAGFLEHAPVGGKARFAKSRRRLRAIECAVNLNRGQVRAGISELFGVRQAFRIEFSASIVCNDLAMIVTPLPAFSPWMADHRRAPIRRARLHARSGLRCARAASCR